MASNPGAFACQPCRASKRRCDGAKPQCSTCSKASKVCTYVFEKKTRKRKYWDESYVKSLESQIQSLLALQKTEWNLKRAPDTTPLHEASIVRSESSNTTQNHPDFPPTRQITDEAATHAFSQSSKVMEELSVMMWRTNLADGVTIDNDSEPKVTPIASSSSAQKYSPIRTIPECAKDRARVERLAGLFLQHINSEHQFTQYKTTDSFSCFPDQKADVLLLHSAMLAAGATFEHRHDSLEVSNQFAELSESLVFACFKNASSIFAIQGLCILSWRSLALGQDHIGWAFLSMAAGLAVHLKLHVLVLDEVASQHLQPTRAKAQTFWSFYMTDRTSISILGRNCVLPWRRANVPAIDAFLSGEDADLAELSFAWQCKLWYMHDRNMDQIFSSSFEKCSISDQVTLLVSMHETLNQFMKSRDPRLDLGLGRGQTPKPVLLFHMAYQMTILITMPPFLRVFASARTETQLSHARPLVLQSITSAATSMIRLVQNYCKWYGFEHANPLLIHHLLSASIVHLMNTTTKSPTFRRYSTRSVRKCITLLHEMGRYWEVRSQKSINTIHTLAQRWGVEDVLSANEHIASGSGDSDALDHIPPFLSDADYNSSTVDRIPQQNIDYLHFPQYQHGIQANALDDTEQQYDLSIMDLPVSGENDFGLSPFFPNFGNIGDFFWSSEC
ncbi:hypothetical protein N7528_002761 [Penicillium herquei]|nr:hypothetical protein N7528_002761 [Penicillium herquei]